MEIIKDCSAPYAHEWHTTEDHLGIGLFV
eukprot:g24333.t1